jgi:hypothetical protein
MLTVMAHTTLDDLRAYAQPWGLSVLGAFHPGAEDAVPNLGADGTLVLLGNTGTGFWDAVADTIARAESVAARDPLDDWSRATVGRMAADFSAQALYPFGGPPYLPFQRWALRCGGFHRSPTGLLVHPDFGTWYAFRGALAFDRALDLPPRDGRTSPCESCAGKPCLTACPVGAFDGRNYDVPACADHLDTQPEGPCMTRGCLARHACPAGRGAAYPTAQAAYHMRCFRNP